MTDLTLGIETSGFEGSIALRRGGQTLGECRLERRRHAQTLIAQVRSLLDQHQLKPHDVTTVAVSHGPGSFTGLRVGVVFAKTFAFATGCRLVAVDTLECVAAAAPEDVDQITVIADAQREQLFVGHYRRGDRDRCERLGPIEIVDFDAFCDWAVAQSSPHFAVTGPGLPRVVESLAESVRTLPEPVWIPGSTHVARIGEQLAADGILTDPATVEPFYIRRSSAEDKRSALAAS